MSNSPLDPVDGLPDLGNQGRRSSLEMVCDVLGVLSLGSTKPTWILQKANMSWKVLSSHLEYLYSRGLVAREAQRGKRVEYKLTQKGQTVLRMYEDLKQSLYGAISTAEVAEFQRLAHETPLPSIREPRWPKASRYDGFGG